MPVRRNEPDPPRGARFMVPLLNLLALAWILLVYGFLDTDWGREQRSSLFREHPVLSNLSGLVISILVLRFELRRDPETGAGWRWFGLIISSAGVLLFLSQLVELALGR